MNAKRPPPRNIIIKMTKVKGKERILKAAREKQRVTYKGTPKGYQLIFQQKLCRQDGSGMIYLKC